MCRQIEKKENKNQIPQGKEAMEYFIFFTCKSELSET